MADCSELTIEPLSRQHERGAFDCGVEPINNFFRNNARRQHEAYQVRVFVVCDPGTDTVIGFYSLTMQSFTPKDMSEEALAKFARVNSVPTIYLAMIGVNTPLIGTGVGYCLMMDAFDRALSIADQVGTYAITLNALNDEIAKKYERYGFELFQEGELAMFLPLHVLRKAESEESGSS